MNLAPSDVERDFVVAIEKSKWSKSDWELKKGLTWESVAKSLARAMTRVAAKFEVGDVVRKEGFTFRSSRGQKTLMVVEP